jgi:hypothetical protein
MASELVHQIPPQVTDFPILGYFGYRQNKPLNRGGGGDVKKLIIMGSWVVVWNVLEIIQFNR